MGNLYIVGSVTVSLTATDILNVSFVFTGFLEIVTLVITTPISTA